MITKPAVNEIAKSTAEAAGRFTGSVTLRLEVQNWPPVLMKHLLERLAQELGPAQRRIRGVRTSSHVFQMLGLTKSTGNSGDYVPQAEGTSRFPVVIIPEWFDDIEVVVA